MDLLMRDEEQMYVTGMILLFDIKDFSMAHFAQLPLPMMKKIAPIWEVHSTTCTSFTS